MYLSGELVHISKGYTTVIDECGNTFNVSVNDPNFLSKKFKGIRSGYVPVKDSNGNTFSVSKNDPRYLSGEYVYIMTGMITVRDINGHTFNISNNDPRYLSGELVPTWTGRHHTEKSINQLKETYKRIGHQQGEKNSQFGTCWINNGIDNKKIKKEELEKYLNNNWLTGRSSKKHI